MGEAGERGERVWVTPRHDSPRNIDSLINEQHAGNILSAVEGTASDPRFDAGQDKNGTSPSERSN